MLNLEMTIRRRSSFSTLQKNIWFLLLCVFVASPGFAQTLGLPSLDGITMFYRAGRPSVGPWKATPTAPCGNGWSRTPLCGWGFETTYVLLGDKEKTSGGKTEVIPATAEKKEGKPKWGAELAVGYDFLNLHATPRGSNLYEIRGSVQTLPSITLYVSWDASDKVSLYSGIGTGLVVLKNLRAYDASGRVYALSGDTWGFTPSLGVLYHLRERDESTPGVNFFVELSYEVQNFPSVSYVLPPDVKTLPSDLPRSLAANGPVLNVGFEFALKKKPPKPACCQ